MEIRMFIKNAKVDGLYFMFGDIVLYDENKRENVYVISFIKNPFVKAYERGNNHLQWLHVNTTSNVHLIINDCISLSSGYWYTRRDEVILNTAFIDNINIFNFQSLLKQAKIERPQLSIGYESHKREEVSCLLYDIVKQCKYTDTEDVCLLK